MSPNELSFGTVESWKAIYGQGTNERPMPIKSPFYDIYGAGFRRLCIGSERDPVQHARMRKMLNPAFSQRMLLEQESIISGVIDQFVRVIGEKAPPGSKGINMTKWYEMATFDTLGEMAFGESFHSIETGKLHSEPTTPDYMQKLLTWVIYYREVSLLGRYHSRPSVLHHNCR